MSRFAEVGQITVWMKGLRGAVEAGCGHAPTLEAASQATVHAMYDAFDESLVLVRLFATLPTSALPADLRAEMERVAAAGAPGQKLKPSTPVLALLGTYGLEPDWRDRRRSRGHAGVPLVSSTFVNGIPMMARVLLDDLGLDLQSLDLADRQPFIETGLFKSGAFHVPDARTDVDSRGRRVVPAQDFVQQYGVITVFGAGAAFLGTPIAVTLLCFTRDVLEAEVGHAALTALSQFRALTQRLVNDKLYFNPSGT